MKDEFEGTSLRAPRCYESHPVLKIGKGLLYGGSASWPVYRKADIYVALQDGSTSGLSSDPWNEKGHVIEIHFGISDQRAPKDVVRFKKMIDWLCNQLQDGKRVHVGCIGGHGRTGTVLSAIVAQALEKKDAIQYVRKHYCNRAVESSEQIKFLMDHYGVSKVGGSKDYRLLSEASSGPVGFTKRILTGFGGAPKNGHGVAQVSPSPILTSDRPPKQQVPKGYTKEMKTFGPLAAERCLWRTKR